MGEGGSRRGCMGRVVTGGVGWGRVVAGGVGWGRVVAGE